MAFSGAAIAYSATGGLILYSGVKGATISDTVKALLSGTLTVSDTEKIGSPSVDISAGSPSASGSSSAASGSASQNYLTIANFLVSNGYSKIAAAGICGCVAGESSANPEAKGGGSYGIIQEQGSQYAGLVTGDASKDLDAQLQALLTYNENQGASLIAMLNAQTDPVAAADFYSQYFERPLIADSDVSASVAQSVYSELTANPAPGVTTSQTPAEKTATELSNG